MLKDLRTGQRVREKFAVISIAEKKTVAGKPYLVIELGCVDGTITGKVWAEAMVNVDLREGLVAEIDAMVEEYRGAFNFNILQSRTLVDENFDNYLSEKPTMVFDIETVGKAFEELDEVDQDYLVNNLEKKFEGTKEQLYDRTALYPMWGWVVTVGMWNPFSKKGVVYYVEQIKNKKLKMKNTNRKSKSKDNLDITQTEDIAEVSGDSPQILNPSADGQDDNSEFTYRGFKDEKEMLEAFWETARKYERFVTYNGSGFDWPFLVFRSGVHRIKVPFETKGSTDKFVDLAQKIQMSYRSFKLEQVCKAFGITNPKTKEVSGQEVAKLYRSGRLTEIVEYVGRDVKSTGDLYLVWKNYLAGRVVV